MPNFGWLGHVQPWLGCHPTTAVAGLCPAIVAVLWVTGSCLAMVGHDPTFFCFAIFLFNFFFFLFYMRGRMVFSFSIIYLRENGQKVRI